MRRDDQVTDVGVHDVHLDGGGRLTRCPGSPVTVIADSTVVRSGIGTSLPLVTAHPAGLGDRRAGVATVGVGVGVGDRASAWAWATGWASASGWASAWASGRASAWASRSAVGVGDGVPPVSTVTSRADDHGPVPVRLIARALSQCAPSARCSTSTDQSPSGEASPVQRVAGHSGAFQAQRSTISIRAPPSERAADRRRGHRERRGHLEGRGRGHRACRSDDGEPASGAGGIDVPGRVDRLRLEPVPAGFQPAVGLR